MCSSDLKLRFLTIEYVHPDMDHYVPIEIPENMMYVGNEILSSTFIYRHLHYTCRDFVFDERYKIMIMTKDVKFIELTSNQYIYLNDVDSYDIIKFESI